MPGFGAVYFEFVPLCIILGW